MGKWQPSLREVWLLLGVAVVLVAILTAHATPIIWGTLRAAWQSDIPQGWATVLAALLGALIAAGVLAYQARVGFANLQRSQSRQAALDREARAAQAQLDRDAREHQYELNRRAEAERVRTDRMGLASSIIGELSWLLDQYSKRLPMLQVQNAVLEQMAEHGHEFTGAFKIDPPDYPVFRARVAEIGKLGPSTASDVVEIFGILTARINMEPGTVSSPKMLAVLVQSMIDAHPAAVADGYHVMSRLIAAQMGEPDPGTLFHQRRARKIRAQNDGQDAPNRTAGDD